MGVGMLPSVLYHVISSLERLSADITNMWPLRGVRQQVCIPHMRRSEVLLANVTRIWLNARVSGHVGRQVPLRREHFAALLALVRSAVLLHVVIEILLRQEPLVANAALELIFVQVGHFPVLVQRVVARVEFPTDVAHVLGRTVSADVELQVPFHLEAFPAVLAGELVVVGVSSDVMGLQIVLRLRTIVALVAAMKQTQIQLLVSQPVSFQVALVLERLVASCAFERSMEAVLAGDVA